MNQEQQLNNGINTHIFKILSCYARIATSFCMIAAISFVVSANEFDYDELPILSPNPDFNGVDPLSGLFSTSSPLKFNAPGASKLNINYSFTGRRESFSLNVYLTDKTYTIGESGYTDSHGDDAGDPAVRHIKVHLGNQDKMFTCNGLGDCRQDLDVDGMKLVRESDDNYVFTDNRGTVYRFFPLWYSSSGLTNFCGDYESGCNAAEYHAYSYASTITYPSGEKLNFEPNYSSMSIDGQNQLVSTIRSNLGYKLVFLQGITSSSLDQENGIIWQSFMQGFIPSETHLYSGDAKLLRKWVSGLENTDGGFSVSHRDLLDRVYSAEYKNGSIVRCGGGELGYSNDHTPVVPVEVTTPGGITTSIGYKYTEDGNFVTVGPNSTIPVNTITRGEKTWSYSTNELVSGDWSTSTPNAAQRTITGPDSNRKTVEFGWVKDGYHYGASGEDCATGFVGQQYKFYQDELSRTTEYTYTPDLSYSKGNLDIATLPEDNGYDYDYDDRGNLTKITQKAKPGATESERVIFQAAYPATCSNPKTCNKPTWVKDGKGLQTDYEYYAEHGGIKSVTQPAVNSIRAKTTYTYTAVDTGDGQLYRQTGTSMCITGSSCSGTADELKTTTTYWNNTLLPKTITTAAGDNSVSATITYTYNDAGLVETEQDAEGNVTHYFYDAVGRKIGEIGEDPDGSGPLPRTAQYTVLNGDDKPTDIYNGSVTGTAKANLTGLVSNHHSHTKISYDSLGRKDSESVTADGSKITLTHYSYDSWSRLLCTAQRMNVNSTATNACSPEQHTTYGYDRITKNEYDVAGQLIKIYKAYGTALQQVYKAIDYTDNGKPEYITDANNNKAKLQYDGYDRQTHWYFPNKSLGNATDSSTLAAAEQDYEQYGYDANDNRTSYRKRDGTTINYAYDNLNRVKQKTVPNLTNFTAHTQHVYYGYDNRGLELYARFGSASGNGITRNYNALGHIKDSTINLDGMNHKLSYTSDKNGVRKTLTYPDNALFSYQTDKLARLTAITHNSAGTLAAYSYDSKGQLDTVTGGISTDYDFVSGRLHTLSHDLTGSHSDNQYGFGYNPVSQVVSLTTSNSIYAPLPLQQSSQNYVVNGLNQYTSVGGDSFSYDANANLTDDGDQKYTFDRENRLIQVTDSSDNLKAQLHYDPLGRLYKLISPIKTTYFLYDGDELVAEYDSGSISTVENRYVHGLGIDDPVAWFSGNTVSSANLYHLRANHQGSLVAIADNNGGRFEIPRYDTWGYPESTPPARFGYTGQAWLDEIGLYYYKARIYHPKLGRFLQTDPVGYNDQMNLYAYVGNDPVNMVDPTGEKSYLVSRPLASKSYQGRLVFAHHNFIVSNADFPGDMSDKVKIISFGKLPNGNMGRVFNKVQDVDRQHWKSLESKYSTASYREIDAPDAEVISLAEGVQENLKYRLIPDTDKNEANSNSGAGAVANQADDGSTSVDNYAAQPGHKSSFKVTICSDDGAHSKGC